MPNAAAIPTMMPMPKSVTAAFNEVQNGVLLGAVETSVISDEDVLVVGVNSTAWTGDTRTGYVYESILNIEVSEDEYRLGPNGPVVQEFTANQELR